MPIYHVISTFAMFMLAQCVHSWQRASEAVNSKSNGITSYSQYLHVRASEIASRILLVSFLFGGWASGELPDLIAYIAPGTAKTMLAHPVSVTWWTAGLLGYFGDSFLYFVVGLVARVWPGVRQEVPPTFSSAVQKQTDAPVV